MVQQTFHATELHKEQTFAPSSYEREVMFIPILDDGKVLMCATLVMGAAKEVLYFPTHASSPSNAASKNRLNEILTLTSDLTAEAFTKVGCLDEDIEVFAAWGCRSSMTTNSTALTHYWVEKSLLELLAVIDDGVSLVSSHSASALAECFADRLFWHHLLDGRERNGFAFIWGAYVAKTSMSKSSNPFRNTLQGAGRYEQWRTGWLEANKLIERHLKSG